MMRLVREVVYSADHWELLALKRSKAASVMEALLRCGILNAVVHGSVARGDVRRGSDVDVALTRPYPHGLVRACLEEHGFRIYSVRIVQATPRHTPKVYTYLDPEEEVTVSNPLSDLQGVEIEYFRFSGMVDLQGLRRGVRVLGVNKALRLIEPVEWGHREYEVRSFEWIVARRLGISIETVLDRVEAISRRSVEGRGGLYLDVEVPHVDEVEGFIERLCREDVAFRKASKTCP